jgi:N utilization substance protein A
MAVQTDFLAAVNQIAAERGIDPKEVVEAIAEAIVTGFRENFAEDSAVKLSVKIDSDLGHIAVVQTFNVVKTVKDTDSEISLADAKKHKADIAVGDEIDLDITPQGDFGRVAAQAAKQVILQKIREAERETQLKEFEDKMGEIEYAVVQRMDGDSVIWEVGRTLAVMPAEERIPGEYYRSGTRHKVLLKEIRELPRGKTLIISRADADFLKALFFLEVPELSSGSVEIKTMAREAGSRSKVAVTSNVDGIDPIGSCVGQRGIRINAITNELRFDNREEKIDIILWDEDDQQFIANALSPAEVKKVEIVNAEEREAKVTVPEEQLSLAIGRDGQNVRLAAKLVGWKLDIVGEGGAAAEGETGEEAETEAKAENELEALGLSARIVKVLDKAGITTKAQLEEYKDDFTQIEGIAKKSAEEIASKLS